MRWLWIALAAFACGASADEPSAAVERGRYVATAANCISCHTRDNGAAYAGGRSLATPLGPIHSTNITPDRETGIGSWTEEDLRRALREGIAADGRHLFPAFPYPFYTRLSDGDIADLYAFLRTLKPVRYVPPDNGRAFRMRWPMATWKALNLVVGAYRPDAARSAEWNRGAYLVQGPGHCGACHTPRDWSLATQSSEPLRGAVMQRRGQGRRRSRLVRGRPARDNAGPRGLEDRAHRRLSRQGRERAGRQLRSDECRDRQQHAPPPERRPARDRGVPAEPARRRLRRGGRRAPRPRKPAGRCMRGTAANATAPRDAAAPSRGRRSPAARSCRAKTRPR